MKCTLNGIAVLTELLNRIGLADETEEIIDIIRRNGGIKREILTYNCVDAFQADLQSILIKHSDIKWEQLKHNLLLAVQHQDEHIDAEERYKEHYAEHQEYLEKCVGQSFKVDLDQLIEKVCLSPYFPLWIKENIFDNVLPKKIIEKIQPSSLKVRKNV